MFRRTQMPKKKPTKKKATKKKPKPEKPMSDGFGHLTIRKNWSVRGESVVDGGYKAIDSMECWDGYEWDE